MDRDRLVRIPERTRGVSPPADLLLSTLDEFVLGSVDGLLSATEIAEVVGAAPASVGESLRKLEQAGLIRIVTHSGPPPSLRTNARVGSVRPRDTTDDDSPPASERPSTIPAAAPSDGIDLSASAREAIDKLFAHASSLDHYAILNVPIDADKKTIKRAYYDLASLVHTDRYFRKNLGPYKAKMEVLFARVTLAHDVLTDATKRAEYEQYLGEAGRIQRAERVREEAELQATRAREEIAKAAGPAPSGVTPVSKPPPSSRSTVQGKTVQVDDDSRRRLLAQRLLGGRAPSVAQPQQGQQKSSPDAAMAAIRNLYEERVTRARDAQVQKYVEIAEIAERQKDTVAAANAYRVAASLRPNDGELQKRAADAQLLADSLLRDSYLKQARYEESNGQWAQAAVSWAKVVRAGPNDGDAHASCAIAIVKANGDLHEAARLAQRATAIDPNNASFHAALAQVYLAAGLLRNAVREVETATKLAPEDANIIALRKRIDKPT